VDWPREVAEKARSARPQALRLFADRVNAQRLYDFGEIGDGAACGMEKQYCVEALEGAGFTLQETTHTAGRLCRLDKKATIRLEEIVYTRIESLSEKSVEQTSRLLADRMSAPLRAIFRISSTFTLLLIELRHPVTFEGYWVRPSLDPEKRLDLRPGDRLTRKLPLFFANREVAEECQALLLEALLPVYVRLGTSPRPESSVVVGERIRVE
jgi:hypothetical protein